MGRKSIARLRRNFHLLQSLKRASPQQRKFIIKNADTDLIKTIADVCYNIVSGNLRLSRNKRQQLEKNKSILRRVADKNVKLHQKRREIIQKGGFLPGLIPAISIAASLLGGLLSK